MAHTPVNHPLRPLYRVLAGAAGLYLVLFGAIGFFETSAAPLFARDGVRVLGLRTNLAFALLALAIGALVLIGAVIGRNVDKAVDFGASVLLMVVGSIMLLVLQTEANVLNFSVATVIACYVVGLLLLTASLYAKVGSAEDAAAEEAFRHAH